MAQIQEDLSVRIQSLERELQAALEDKERAFRCHWERGKAKFEEDVLSEQRKLKHWLPSCIRQIETVRSEFVDLRTLTSPPPDTSVK